MNQEFEFKVKHYKKDPGNKHSKEGWEVSLPHQCDRWEISGGQYYPSTQEKAVEDLEGFIAEAQKALNALREGREHNLSTFDEEDF